MKEKIKNKKYGILFLPFLIIVIFSNLLFSLQFVNTYGGTGDEVGYSVLSTNDGGYIIAGITNSYGAGEYDFLVLKLTNNGEIEWAKTIGGNKTEDPCWNLQIIQTQDGGYLLGGHTYSWGNATYGGAIVSKLDQNGNLLWSRIISGGALANFGGMIEVNDGYIIIGETYAGSPMMGFFIIKLDYNGNSLWQKYMNILSWELPWFAIPTRDGGFAFAGLTSASGNYSDMVIAKFDNNANFEWAKRWGTNDKDEVYSIFQTEDGGYICISGIRLLNGPQGFIISRLDPSGNHLWSKEFVGIPVPYRPGCIESPIGGYLISCRINNEFAIVKLDANGNFSWAKLFGSGLGTGFGVSPDGGFLVTGKIEGDVGLVKFDENELTCMGTDTIITLNNLDFTTYSLTPTFSNLNIVSQVTPTVTSPSISYSIKCSVGGEEDYYQPKKEKASFDKPVLLSMPTFINNKIFIRFSKFSKEKMKIILLDTSGKEILSKSYPFTYSVEIEGKELLKLAKGVYFLKIYSGKKQIGEFKLLK